MKRHLPDCGYIVPCRCHKTRTVNPDALEVCMCRKPPLRVVGVAEKPALCKAMNCGNPFCREYYEAVSP